MHDRCLADVRPEDWTDPRQGWAMVPRASSGKALERKGILMAWPPRGSRAGRLKRRKCSCLSTSLRNGSCLSPSVCLVLSRACCTLFISPLRAVPHRGVPSSMCSVHEGTSRVSGHPVHPNSHFQLGDSTDRPRCMWTVKGAPQSQKPPSLFRLRVTICPAPKEPFAPLHAAFCQSASFVRTGPIKPRVKPVLQDGSSATRGGAR